MFPIWDDQVHNWHFPIFSRIFIAINILVFVFQASLPQWEFASFVHEYGTIPTEILSGVDRHTLLTNMFLHGSWMHLGGNMLYLYVFWDNIEASIGNFKYLIFYILWWVAASLAHIFMSPGSIIPAVWASGAISAVLWAYLVMFPKSKIKVLDIRTMRTFLLPAIYFLLFYIWLQLFSGVGSIWSTGGGTARWAHIWWFAFGRLAGQYLKKSTSGDLVIKEQKTSSMRDLIWGRKKSPFG